MMKDIAAEPRAEFGAEDKSPLVHYTGTWTKEERRIVEGAVQDVERKLFDKATPMLGKPWVCSRYAGTGRTLYLAHRAQWMSKVLTAQSAEELAQRIQKRLP